MSQPLVCRCHCLLSVQLLHFLSLLLSLSLYLCVFLSALVYSTACLPHCHSVCPTVCLSVCLFLSILCRQLPLNVALISRLKTISLTASYLPSFLLPSSLPPSSSCPYAFSWRLVVALNGSTGLVWQLKRAIVTAAAPSGYFLAKTGFSCCLVFLTSCRASSWPSPFLPLCRSLSYLGAINRQTGATCMSHRKLSL